MLNGVLFQTTITNALQYIPALSNWHETDMHPARSLAGWLSHAPTTIATTGVQKTSSGPSMTSGASQVRPCGIARKPMW